MQLRTGAKTPPNERSVSQTRPDYVPNHNKHCSLLFVQSAVPADVAVNGAWSQVTAFLAGLM